MLGFLNDILLKMGLKMILFDKIYTEIQICHNVILKGSSVP